MRSRSPSRAVCSTGVTRSARTTWAPPGSGAADTAMTKNYLRFLVERIVVGEDRIEIQAKANNAVAFMGRVALEPGEIHHPETVLAKGSEWLRL